LLNENQSLSEDIEFLQLQRTVAVNTASQLSIQISEIRNRVKHIKRQCKNELSENSSPFLDWLYFELKSMKFFKKD